MAKMTLDELRALRDSQKKEMNRREIDNKDITIIIGMGTCGIAAGARETLRTFLDEIEKKGITNASIKQTGCMGLCSVEPTVEIVMPGMPSVVYGEVTAEVAKDIVSKHIINKKLVSGHVYDKPAADNVVKK